MPTTLELLGRDPITYESACKSETNILNKLGYASATKYLYADLWMQRRSIAALTKHHLGLGSEDSCTVLKFPEWMRGSFNTCIPVEVRSGGVTRKLLFRCPMPHKLAESRYAGTVNEKLRCEVATYVWMQERCPDVRIPHLFGFGLLDGHHVSRLDTCAV